MSSWSEKAAAALLADRFILQEDYDAYIRSAEAPPLVDGRDWRVPCPARSMRRCSAPAHMFAMAATGPALAEVDRVVVKELGPMGTFGGRQYTWVTAAMEGTVARDDGTTGHYRVPVSLMYPDRDANGFGFVDVVNSADFSNYLDETAPFGKRKITTRAMYSIATIYAAKGSPMYPSNGPAWSPRRSAPSTASSKMAMDGWEIITDATRFVRNPDKLEGELPFKMEAVTYVIGHGIRRRDRC